jgi:hypothetical protein
MTTPSVSKYYYSEIAYEFGQLAALELGPNPDLNLVRADYSAFSIEIGSQQRKRMMTDPEEPVGQQIPEVVKKELDDALRKLSAVAFGTIDSALSVFRWHKRDDAQTRNATNVSLLPTVRMLIAGPTDDALREAFNDPTLSILEVGDPWWPVEQVLGFEREARLTVEDPDLTTNLEVGLAMVGAWFRCKPAVHQFAYSPRGGMLVGTARDDILLALLDKARAPGQPKLQSDTSAAR